MKTTTQRRVAAAATALALTAALAACSDSEQATADPATGVEQPSNAESGAVAAEDHADADTAFAQMMIVHHEGAVEMADLAVERASTEEVRALGERIAAAQGPEIELMSGWLESWGEDLSADADHGGMDHGSMDMDGMSQEEAMASLSELDGAEFDRAFLQMMVAHHRGAVEMAETQLADGRNAEAAALAQQIIDDQTKEIAEMEDLLADL